MLDEFYCNLKSAGVSSLTGSGMEAFFAAIDASVDDFVAGYWQELQERRRARGKAEEGRHREEMARVMSDMAIGGGGGGGGGNATTGGA